ncbi:hypothetical protein [Xanthobacter pseudotagetidis]|uniref:hypothetical protein n=1 Tax=Xanthobacter pseudotagetidis TaxID=3119911 RepID=UPI00372B37EB
MSERNRLTRRHVLAGVATLSAGITASAVALASVPDPVFAAIETFRQKRGAFNEALRHRDWAEEKFPDDYPQMEAAEAARDVASAADADAWWSLINTAPTTREGALAFLAMLTDWDGYGGGPHPEFDELEAICASLGAFISGGELARTRMHAQ